MTAQTINQRITISDFLKRNRKPRPASVACVDSSSSISIRAEVLCERELVGHRLIPRTIYR